MMARLMKTNWALLVVTGLTYVGFEMGLHWLGMPYKGDNINGAYKARGGLKPLNWVIQSLTIWTFIPVWVVWYGVRTCKSNVHFGGPSTKNTTPARFPIRRAVSSMLTPEGNPSMITGGLTSVG